MNLGVWQEDATPELQPDEPPDCVIRTFDGRQINPRFTSMAHYQIEIQLAPLADAGELTDF